MRKNTAGQHISFNAVATADGSAIATGTPVVYYTIDGGTQAVGGGATTHEGNGSWDYAPITAETNGDHVSWVMVLTGAVNDLVNTYPVSFDPTSSTDLGLSTLTGNVPQTGDNFPETSINIPASIASIGSGSTGARNFSVTGDNIAGAIKGATFVGVSTSGTYLDTKAEDGVYDNTTHIGNAIDKVYEVDVGVAFEGTEISIIGYLISGNDTIEVQVYDHVASSWGRRKIVLGQNASSNTSISVKLLGEHTGDTGVDEGKVYIRFICSAQTSPDLFVDELLVSAVSTSKTVGYADGAIWINGNKTNTNTVPFIDGTADKPVSTWAAVLALRASVGLDRVRVSGGTNIQLTSDSSNMELLGQGYTLDLNNQIIDGMHVVGGTLSGAGIAVTNHPIFEACPIAALVVDPCIMRECWLEGALTVNSAGNYYINNCRTRIAGGGAFPIDMGLAVAGSALSIKNASGGFSFTNFAVGDVSSVGGPDMGTISVNGTGGSVDIRGIGKPYVDLSGGAVTVTGTGYPTNRVNNLIDEWDDGGRLDTLLDSKMESSHLSATAGVLDNVNTIDGSVVGSVGSLGAQAKLDVNAEVDTANSDYGALKPTVAGRTIDVALTGEAGIDLDNTVGTLAKGVELTGFNDIAATDVVSSGAINTLAGAVVNVDLVDVTTTNTDMVAAPDNAAIARIELDTQDLQARTPAALVGGRMSADIGSIDGNQPLATRLKEYIDANVLFSDTAQAGTANSITLATGTSLIDNDLRDYAVYINGGTGAGQFARIEDVVALTQVATIKTAVNGWLVNPDATSTYVILPAGSIMHLSSVHQSALTEITTEIDSNSTQLESIVSAIAALNDPTVAEILTATMTESYAADGVAPSVSQILFELRALAAEKSISGTTMTTKKLDGAATAATYSLDDAVSPTSITRST